ncbi:restriction endonuclease subunit S [Beggiatoa leptomitoformis]|uniref:Restriction endonuclease subunit S n=1 Tax=Beggiatoa leptomitoformis TaxID=288004 RepID=A0A2N9YIG3_9GAMM|nr:restriction endonuclease subunit S [Beggiatoa leptomitoformis]ALG69394.2 restriction endonuclease subunit S [Beggiatoa leptomitoformis]AUI70189.1 restriction endonuclease subunit S [Beggiatoa leptomitoformis]
MNSNKNLLVPKLRFPEFLGAGGWEGETLGEIGENLDSQRVPITEQYRIKGKIPYYGASGIIDFVKDFIFDEDLLCISEDGANLVTRTYPIAFSISGKTWVNNHVHILRFKNKSTQSMVENYLNSIRLDSYLTGMAQPKLNRAKLDIIPVPLPSLPEQQKIADCLTSLDDLIISETQQRDALKRHKKGLMQQLFPAEGETVPKLRFPEFLEAGEWEGETLGEIGENLDSQRVPITEQYRIKGKIPYYGASGIIDFVKDFIFDEDLLCISEDGANLVTRTYPIAFSISGKTWVNNHVHILRFKNKSTQSMVENYLNSIRLDSYLTGMAQPKLNRAKLDIIPVPLPSLPEQQKIASCLSSLDDLITAQAQKIAALKKHKKGLMQQLFPKTSEL